MLCGVLVATVSLFVFAIIILLAKSGKPTSVSILSASPSTSQSSSVEALRKESNWRQVALGKSVTGFVSIPINESNLGLFISLHHKIEAKPVSYFSGMDEKEGGGLCSGQPANQKCVYEIWPCTSLV